jgi:hypothetical protein
MEDVGTRLVTYADDLVIPCRRGKAEAALQSRPRIPSLDGRRLGCGAVKAACDVVTKNATYPGAIGAMIEPILPAALAARGEPGDYVNNAAKLSAQRTAAKLASASTLISGLAGQGKLKIVSAIYDLQTGAVTVLG